MKLPMSWLSEFVDINGITPKMYSDAMTMSGSKVEGIDYLGEEIQNVVTGEIISTEKHPDSDHLIICQLNVGQNEPIQIVTGAQNVAPGKIVPAALHKSKLPGGITITKGKLRGVPSNGMMCSHTELGLTLNEVPYGDEKGILLLPEGTPIGEDIRKVLGLDEHVVEFEITSNRPDCLSAIGLARETAATFGRKFSVKAPVVKGSGDDINNYLKIRVDAPELCQRYTAKIVKNIKIEPSPAWLRERLHACGVRPINNIVDITNYVMLEYGQPMHAFDYACLKDGQIIVRKPNKGETIKTLDNQARELTEDMLVIADGIAPVAVAGVMGGAESEITDSTKTVVFESANFHGATVRITAKKLGMRTEASGRFEKGLDPQNTMPAVLRACELIELLGAGEVVDGCIDVDSSDRNLRRLPLECDKINALLGIKLSKEDMVKSLKTLEFDIDGDDVIVPSFRGDIERMCDIAEEVARIYGYNNIPTTLFAGESVLGSLTSKQRFERDIAAFCRTVGFDEAITHSFISPKMYDEIGLPKDSEKRISVKITNPLGEDFSVMRTTTLPSMLDALMHNFSYRNATASLYELGMIYTPETLNGKADDQKLPAEERILTLGTYGRLNFYQLKGAIEMILANMNIQNVSFEPESKNPSYHPGRCAKVMCNDTVLGVFGTVHPAICKEYDLEGEVLTAELCLNNLFACTDEHKLYAPLPKYPASTRDIAVLCDDAIPVAKLEHAIKAAVGNILEHVSLFDVYKGNQIPQGKKSVAYSMILRVADRTLTDEECDKAMKKAISALENEFGATLRG